MFNLTTYENFLNEKKWAPDAVSAFFCLVFLLGFLAAEPHAPQIAAILMVLSFVAGLRYTLPDAAQSIARGEVDVDFLMILVAFGAWHLGHPVEGAALLVLFGASRAMEEYARQRTHSSLEELSAELPKTALRVTAGKREEVSLDDLAVGDELIVRPGERVPIDSEHIEGETTLDLSAITGESEPASPSTGEEIPSGAINGKGLIRLRVVRPSRESAYQKVIALVEDAPARRSSAQVLSDRVGRYFTIAILSASGLAFAYWYFIDQIGFSDSGYRAMVLLVAGSPCAIVLSIPSAILAAIASGARRGILFNGGVALSSLNHVWTIAFDKTGTLTSGTPSVSSVDGEEEESLLALAAELARSSNHPASKAVVQYLKKSELNAEIPAISDIRELPGRGVKAEWRGLVVELGRSRPNGEPIPSGSHVVLYVDDQPRLTFHLAETLREGAEGLIEGLHARGLRAMILSGDTPAATERLAGQIGIDDARGGLSPEDKWRVIREEAAQSHIMMVGDGVNDAPAMAEANVGAAMGVRGSAATLAQADLVLVKDRLPDLLTALELARRTRRIIRQNLFIAIGAAAIMVALALAGRLSLAIGVFGHEGGTVLVVLNSLRLLLKEQEFGSQRPGRRDAPIPASRVVSDMPETCDCK